MKRTFNREELKKLDETALAHLAEADQTNQWERTDALRTLHEKLVERGEKEEAEKRLFDIQLFDLRITKNSKSRFVPMASGTKEDGTTFKYPDVDNLKDPKALKYFESRATTITSPILKCRYEPPRIFRRLAGLSHATALAVA